MRSAVAGLVAAVLLAAAGASASGPADYAAVALNVLPPGQAGGVAFTRNSTDQLPLYDGLTPLGGDVKAADLRRYFKPATLGLGGERAVSRETPRPGVTVVRDRFGVPHVTGRTRDDVVFGAGWVTAQDRQLLLELLRGPGRIAALDVPGVDAFSLALSGKRYVPSQAAERALAAQIELLRRYGVAGRRVIRDMDAYVAGINAWYAKAGLPLPRWTRNDVVSVVALLAAVFGAGGGDEVRRSMFLDALQRRLGAAEGRRVFDDLREQGDAETPVFTERSFPYGGPAPGAGNAVVDDGSFQPWGGGPAAAPLRRRMSNALIVAGKRSATGRPLFVAGPQLGQFYPQIVLELDLRGGGIDARGVGVPGFAFALVIGRGKDFVWSLTSAGGDVVDEYVETLCGDDTRYVFKGECRAMETFDAGELDGRRLVFRRTVHGPVTGYATLAGRRVAIAEKRSTRGRELLSALFIGDLMTNTVRSARDFLRSAAKFEVTFNAFYADDRDVAQFTTGRLPLRPAGVDSGLPTIGTGEWEWRGFLPAARHPQVVNPAAGFLVNWNNAAARGFAAADDNWTYQSVQRVDLLARGLAARKRHTLASVVAAMNRAATQDLRAVEVLPALSAVLKKGATAPTQRAQEALALLEAWRAKGSSRLDRDGDGKVDDPGAAILDAAWPKLADAALQPVLGPLVDRLAALVPRDDPPGPNGNAYGAGWYGYLDKDLRTLLREPVKAPFRTRFCGGGDLSACAAALWAALDAAAAELEASQGPDPGAWRSQAAYDVFAPGILPQRMRFANRPTFQQVFTFARHRPR